MPKLSITCAKLQTQCTILFGYTYRSQSVCLFCYA